MLDEKVLVGVLEKLNSLDGSDSVIVSGRLVLMHKVSGRISERRDVNLMVPMFAYGEDRAPNKIKIGCLERIKNRYIITGTEGGMTISFDGVGSWRLEKDNKDSVLPIVAKPPFYGIRTDTYGDCSEIRVYPDKR